MSDKFPIRFLISLVLLVAYVATPAYFIDRIVPVSVILLVASFTDFIWHIGKEIRPIDILAILGITFYLVSPALTYASVESDWYLGFNMMVIPEEQYFRVAIPGTLALVAGVHFPFKATQVDHKERFEEIEQWLQGRRDTALKLFWIGVACNLLMPIVPGALNLIFTFASYLIYVGALYLWFMNDKNRLIYLIAMFTIPIVKSIRYGMFTELVFMGAFVSLMLLMKYDLKFYKKIAIALGGIIIILFIQSIKYEFRMRTWYDYGTNTLDARLGVFQELAADRIRTPETMYSDLMLSGMLDRTNQGSLTAMAIRYVPEYEPFAKGETIFVSLAASVIPRALWPNKPKVGGAENMKRFTGFELVGSTSMDIGQLGDAYVNFGIMGGAIFLFFYGLTFSFINAKLFEASAGISPAALLWFPVFFAGCIQVDSSVLSTFGHLSKVVIFYLFVRWAFKTYFKQDI